MPREKTQQNRFMHWVQSKGGVVVKIHGDELSAGQPDTIGALQGVPFAIEWKLPGEEPSKLQSVLLDLWNTNGVSSSVQTTCVGAIKWLSRIKSNGISHEFDPEWMLDVIKR